MHVQQYGEPLCKNGKHNFCIIKVDKPCIKQKEDLCLLSIHPTDDLVVLSGLQITTFFKSLGIRVTLTYNK